MIASVILPSYNRLDALPMTLDALARQTVSPDSFEAILVDDGSRDGTLEWLQGQARPYLLMVLSQANAGPGAARNLGARHALGALLVFLDADMIPEPGLVEGYVRAHGERPDAIHLGRILAWPSAYDTLFDRVTRAEMSHDLGPASRELTFYHLASGNFAVGAETFRRLGGFDEALRMTEDTDLGYRGHLAGVLLHYCPAAVGYHNHPKTLEQRCATIRSSAFWTARLVAKHPAMASLLPIYQDILPVTPGRDPAHLAVRKLGRRVLALAATRRLLQAAIPVLERSQASPKSLRSLYYKLMSGYRVEGFRAGMQRVSV